MENNQQTFKGKEENSQESSDKILEYSFSNSEAESKNPSRNKSNSINKNDVNENDDRSSDSIQTNSAHEIQNPNQQAVKNHVKRNFDNTSVKLCPHIPIKPAKSISEEEKWRRSLNREFVSAYKKLEEYCASNMNDSKVDFGLSKCIEKDKILWSFGSCTKRGQKALIFTITTDYELI